MFFKKKEKKHFDANAQGFVLVKSDRINTRIRRLVYSFLAQNKTITKKNVKELANEIEAIVTQELTYKGAEETITKGYIFAGKAKDWNPKKWQKIESTQPIKKE